MQVDLLRLPLYLVLVLIFIFNRVLKLIIIQWTFSILLFGLTIARLRYTTNLPQGDPLNNGVDFYGKSCLGCGEIVTDGMSDPVVVELLVCSVLSFAFAPIVWVCSGNRIYDAADNLRTPPHSIQLTRRYLDYRGIKAWNLHLEMAGIAVLWLLWLIGCGISTVRPIRLSYKDENQLSINDCLLPQNIWPDLSWCLHFAACRVLTGMIAFAWLGWIVISGILGILIAQALKKARPSPPIMVEWATFDSTRSTI